jgi:hypothetical protein
MGDGYLIAEHGSLVELFGVPIPVVEENKREIEDDGLRQSSAIDHELLADSVSYSDTAEMGHYVFAVAYSRRPRCGDECRATVKNRLNLSSSECREKVEGHSMHFMNSNVQEANCLSHLMGDQGKQIVPINLRSETLQRKPIMTFRP